MALVAERASTIADPQAGASAVPAAAPAAPAATATRARDAAAPLRAGRRTLDDETLLHSSGACLLATTATVAAQGGMRLDGSLPTGTTPDMLQHVTIEQHLDTQIPLDLKFRDEAGRDVTLRDYFQKGRPLILAPVYYECPMLCTQVLNGLVDRASRGHAQPGQGLRHPGGELRSEGARRAGARQEGGVRRSLQPAGHRGGLALPDRHRRSRSRR